LDQGGGNPEFESRNGGTDGREIRVNAYALAKLIACVEQVDSRKRLQKCVFLLQEAGCDLGAEYYLHLYGPYSRDVAETIDSLEQAGVLAEEEQDNGPWGLQYSYRITEKGAGMLGDYETTPDGRESLKAVSPFVKKFKTLNEQNLWVLELAATIAFFKVTKDLTWQAARVRTSEFKNVSAARADSLGEAERLAKRIL